MAVRERTYRPYGGRLTRDRWRFLVLPRYAYEDVFRSRIFLATFVISFVWPAVCVLLIYLHHNLQALELMNVRTRELMPIDAQFFLLFYRVQGAMGFAIAFLLGPSLISADLSHNALPLYLARPFSRAEYVLGKLSVLAILLSVISWVPGLLLFCFQALLEGPRWAVANLELAGAIFLAAWVGIAFISLLVLALSAWVRWRVMARGALLGFVALTSALSGAVIEIFNTQWGSVLNPARMLATAWDGLFSQRLSAEVPLWAAWTALLFTCALALFMLWRKVRAYEVVS
jgi:ABC-2 type transport system permease protein